jgi:hypothetical protein
MCPRAVVLTERSQTRGPWSWKKPISTSLVACATAWSRLWGWVRWRGCLADGLEPIAASPSQPSAGRTGQLTALTTSDIKTRSLNPGTVYQIESRVTHVMLQAWLILPSWLANSWSPTLAHSAQSGGRTRSRGQRCSDGAVMLRQHARINMHYFRRPCHVGGGLAVPDL